MKPTPTANSTKASARSTTGRSTRSRTARWHGLRVNGLRDETCPDCGGEGRVEYSRGYRITGSGYGDCEEIITLEECERCEGCGQIVGEEEDEETDEYECP